MDLTDYEWSQIKSYLEAVRPRLTGPESEETLVDIESHIHMAIKARLEAGEQGNLVVSRLCGRSMASAGSRARHWSSHLPQHGDAFMHWRGALHGCRWSNARQQLACLSRPQPLQVFD